MKVGLTLAGVPIEQKGAVARRAQDAGFTAVFTDDNPNGDAIVALTAMAVAAPRIRVGSGILRSFTRHPVAIASAFANLNALSEENVILGFGSGTQRQNLFQYGIDVPRPVDRLRSVIKMVQGNWDSWERGESFRWDDPYYHIGGMPVTRTDLRHRKAGRPSIWIAAVNKRMLQLVGEVADGLAGHPICSVEYLKEVARPAIDAGRRHADAERPFELSAWVITAVDEDRARARRRAAKQVAFYLSTRSYRDVLAFYGCGHLYQPLREAILERGDIEAGATLFPDEVIDQITVNGSVDEIRQQLARYEGIADSVILAIAGAGEAPAHRLKEIEAVLPLGALSR